VWAGGRLDSKWNPETNALSLYSEGGQRFLSMLKHQWKLQTYICRRRNENYDSEITRICENTGFKQVSSCTIMYLVDLESCQNTIHFMLQRF